MSPPLKKITLACVVCLCYFFSAHPLLQSILSLDILAPGGRALEYKWVGVLVVSLRGVNFRFWSRLGC